MENRKKTSAERNPNRVKDMCKNITIVALIIVIFLLLFRSCGATGDCACGPDCTCGNSVLTVDPNATDIQNDNDKTAVQEELNRKVEEGMMNISMHTTVHFSHTTLDGDVGIVNETFNRHPQIVEIMRKDSDEVIYRSGLIPVGKSVETGKLMTELAVGEYECVAEFTSIDEDSGNELGKARAEILVVVE